VLLPRFQPLPLGRARAPFSHPDWIFEVKWDGFRAVLYSDEIGVRLVSRNGNTFKSFPDLCKGLAQDLKGRRYILDGEIVCLDSQGKPQFRNLLFRHNEPHFIAFDLLWDAHARSDDEEEMRRFANGEDTRYLPLIDRKLRLRRVVPTRGERLLFCDHIDADGERLFRLACENDLEGIVAKRRDDPYLTEYANWLKIRNQNYSQWAGCEELFGRERESDPMLGCGKGAWQHVRQRWIRIHHALAAASSEPFALYLRLKIQAFQQQVAQSLQEEMNANRQRLAAALLPAVAKNPPSRWTKFIGPKPSEAEIRACLDRDLVRSFRSAQDLIKEMKVTVIFKDVTYESLSDRKFIEVARKALPNLNMLHEEYLAAEGLTRDAKASAVGELQ
jgi:hypothetical protein